MHRVLERIRRARCQKGFSLVEILVGGLVLVVGLIAMSQLFASSAMRILESDVRSVLNQVAAQELESIRALPYSDIGTVHGWPSGSLPDEETRTVGGTPVKIERAVIFWIDASDSRGTSAPASYRRVTVSVSAVDRPSVKEVEMVSNVAGGSTGGNILVKVQDSQGGPVEGASFTITNDVLVPPISITSSALVTNSVGSMLMPGLTVDPSGNYVVEATKAGYSSATKDGIPVIQDTLQQVVLTIDLVSSMRVHVINQSTGAEMTGLTITMSGPEGYSDSITTQDGGVLLTDLRFSNSAEPYILTLPAGSGYAGQQQSIALPADTHQDVIFNVLPVVTTTTVPPSSTTTTTISSTTTTGGVGGSLLVTVYRAGTSTRLRNAWVNLDGRTGYTNKSGQLLISSLAWTTYDITVTKNDYADYTGTVTVDGAETLRVDLTYTGGGPGPH